MLSRRGFLKASLAGASVTAVSACSTGPLLGARRRRWSCQRCHDAEGRHYIGGVDSSGRQRFQIPVAERCHGGCPQPHGDHVVVFARRPGRDMHVINTRTGQLERSVQAGDGYPLLWSGVYSPDARLLYVTMNNYHTSAGLVRVYDAFDGYRQVADFDLQALGRTNCDCTRTAIL
ncbi:DUF1513 domain-containing protein [Halopseudomonas pachastrellae]|nr:DUF1513 domain-containing protein [Halopseudomonas pachastrellae]